MKVVFVYVCMSRFGFGTWGSRNFDANCISHGIAQLSACVKDAGFKDVELLDIRKCSSWQDFENKLKAHNPDVVCSTMMSPDFDYVIQAFKITKKINPKIITIVGGPHVTALPDEVLAIKEADIAIAGEGEITLVDILNDINNGKELKRFYQGKFVEDLDKLPFEDRELFEYSESVKHPYFVFFSPPMVDIITSRGCMFNCSFCMPLERKIFGPNVKYRSVDNVMKELRMLRDKYHFNSLMIHNDNLLENEAWVEEFCEKYKENGFNQPFYCQGRANLICSREPLIKRLRETGLEVISIGFESANQRILNFLRKGTTVEQNINAVKICRKYNLRINGQFIFGSPTETREEAKDTMDFIRWAKKYMGGLMHCGYNIYTPYPGNDLYQYCKDNDLILIQRHDQYRRDGFTVKEPKIKGVDYAYIQKFIEGDVNKLRRTVEAFRRYRLFHFFEDKMLKFKPVRKFAKHLYTTGRL